MGMVERKYENVVFQQTSLKDARNGVTVQYLQTFYRSIPSRLYSVVESEGWMPNY